MVALRMAVLLDPIGIPRSYITPEKEAADTLIGAYEGEHLLGCCVLTRIDRETVQLRQMAIQASQQQKGLGRSLLAFAETIAKQQGYHLLKLHVGITLSRFTKNAGIGRLVTRFLKLESVTRLCKKAWCLRKKKAYSRWGEMGSGDC